MYHFKNNFSQALNTQLFFSSNFPNISPASGQTLSRSRHGILSTTSRIIDLAYIRATQTLKAFFAHTLRLFHFYSLLISIIMLTHDNQTLFLFLGCSAHYHAEPATTTTKKATTIVTITIIIPTLTSFHTWPGLVWARTIFHFHFLCKCGRTAATSPAFFSHIGNVIKQITFKKQNKETDWGPLGNCFLMCQ